jgi:hypothetical protein
MNRVVVHYDEAGEVSFYVEPGSTLLIVDERAPDDRVYEHYDRSTKAEVDAVLGDSKIGNRFDGSAAAKKLGQVATN